MQNVYVVLEGKDAPHIIGVFTSLAVAQEHYPGYWHPVDLGFGVPNVLVDSLSGKLRWIEVHQCLDLEDVRAYRAKTSPQDRQLSMDFENSLRAEEQS